jgi:hypothetical protein
MRSLGDGHAGRTPIRPVLDEGSQHRGITEFHAVSDKALHGERVQYLLTRRATGGRSVYVEVR